MKTNQILTLIPTKQLNKPTIQVTIDSKSYLLYSKYNPTRDPQAFAEKHYDEKVENYLIYGLGLGYHINELDNLIKNNNKNYHIYVIECNQEILKLAMDSINLNSIIRNENITLIMMDNDKKSYDKLNKVLSIKDIEIAIHRPSLNIIPPEFRDLKDLLEEFMVRQNTIEDHSHILDDNYKENIKNFDYNIDTLFNKHLNKPLYLVAAGPSLDKNIHELARIKDNGIMLSVGRAVRPLVAAGILPDYIIITDPSSMLYNGQLKGLDIDVPIIVLSTCDKNVMLNYKGKKYIALQNGYLPAEKYGRANDHDLVDTGGSVATTGLDVAIRMGCNPITFVGQDLAYTGKKTHSKDTFSKEISKGVMDSHRLRKVEDVHGDIVHTSKNLSIYRRWIEGRIAKEGDIEFIDGTEGGAKIKGTKIMKLKDIIE